MYFSGEGFLIAVKVTMAGGKPTSKTEVETQVFYNEKAVRQSEYYAAAAIGKKLEKMVEVHTEDWSGQTLFRDESGRRFEIFRSYAPDGKDTVELTLITEGAR